MRSGDLYRTLLILTAFITTPAPAHIAAEPPHILCGHRFEHQRRARCRERWLIREHLRRRRSRSGGFGGSAEVVPPRLSKSSASSAKWTGPAKASTAELAAAWKDADILITPGRHARFFTAWAKRADPTACSRLLLPDPVTHRRNLPDGGTLAGRICGIEKLPSGHFDQLFKSRRIYGWRVLHLRPRHAVASLVKWNRQSVLELGLDGLTGIACVRG